MPTNAYLGPDDLPTPSEVADAVIEILAALVLAKMVSEGVWPSKSYSPAKAVPLFSHAQAVMYPVQREMPS